MKLFGFERPLPSLMEWFARQLKYLFRESIIYRLSGRSARLSTYPFDYRVQELQFRPLGMLFYNVRAIVLGCAAIYLAFMALLVQLVSVPDQALKTLWLLASCWLISVTVTVIFHHGLFLKELKDFVSSHAYNQLPRLFDRYFIVDFALIYLMIVFGCFYFKVNVGYFALLLLANVVMYGSFGGKDRLWRLAFMVFLLLLLFMSLSTSPIVKTRDVETPLISVTLHMGPILCMLLLIIIPIGMISWLRIYEQRVAHHRLQLLGKYVNILSQTSANDNDNILSHRKRKRQEFYFRERVNKVLEDLCSQPEPFWFRSACLWFMEKHQERGNVFLPGPRVRYKNVKDYNNGVSVDLGSLNLSTPLVVIPSLKDPPSEMHSIVSVFFPNLDVPAAFIPLVHSEVWVGVLILYGREKDLPIQAQDAGFLKSLSLIICNSLEQSQRRYKVTPLNEMDNLFRLDSLEEVFPKAAVILKKYLVADGCMVIFRSNPNGSEMNVVAKEGVDDSIFISNYTIDKDKSGECVRKGEVIRYDDAQKHRGEFDSVLFENLERAIGKPIVSWMVVPIGPKYNNYGIIKVVNRTFRCSWFTEEDRRLGEDLALRLHVIIEKFLQIKKTETAKENAQFEAEKADKATSEAQQAVSDLQNSLMTMTHQLLGPLCSLVGGVSSLEQKEHLRGDSRKVLTNIRAFAEDAIALCYGSATTFAMAAGQEVAYTSDVIDAPVEMRKLCERLQITNSRPDLNLVYKQAPGFPELQIDKNIFTSVMYSLVHNAMKYADSGSDVILECSYEQPAEEAALKVKTIGPEIQSHETERIFEQFKRGYFIKKGKYHHGVGLGLWVARELMRSIGGDLTVELSLAYPRLSVFVVHIPSIGV